MDVLKAIRERRSIRKYKSTEVETDKVDIILQAGRWAPSASNKQPWHFIVVRDETMRKKFAEVHNYGRFMAESPVVIVVLGDPAKYQSSYHIADPHNAVMNMLLAAHYEGLSTCWMGIRDTDIEPKFKEFLNIPDDKRVICSISVGYGDQERTSTRFPLDEMVSWEEFGNKTR